ncbi:MAG: hypothetical protein EOP44_05480, partial [Sphingobacteriaceae bacterium]
MKKLLYIFFILILFSSCKKFLEVEPQLQVDQSEAIINAGTAATAANGMFNLLGANGYYGSNFQALAYLSGLFEGEGAESTAWEEGSKELTLFMVNNQVLIEQGNPKRLKGKKEMLLEGL